MLLTIQYTNEKGDSFKYPERKFTAELPNDADIPTIMDAFRGLLVGMTFHPNTVSEGIHDWLEEADFIEKNDDDDDVPEM